MKQINTAILIAWAVLLTGCVGNGQVGGSFLADTHWVVASWSAGSPDPAAYHMTADFGAGQMSGKAAVNAYNGEYKAAEGGAFALGPIAATEMAGSEDAMRAEGIYFHLLEQAKRYSADPSTLRLRDSGNNVLLVFKKH